MARRVVDDHQHWGVHVQATLSVPLLVPLLEALNQPHERHPRLGLLWCEVEHEAAVHFFRLVSDNTPPTFAFEDELEKHERPIPAGDGSGLFVEVFHRKQTKLKSGKLEPAIFWHWWTDRKM